MRIHIATLAVSGRGGMERVFQFTDDALLSLGHEVWWLFPAPPTVERGWDAFLGSRKIYYATHTWRSGAAIVELALGLKEALRRLPRPDLVLAPSSTNPVLFPVCRLAYEGVPVVAWHHGGPSLVPADQQPLIRYADVHLTVAEAITEELRALDPGKPVVTVFNPIFGIGNRLVPRPTDGRLVVVFAGRIDRQKRLDLVVDAVARVAQRVRVRLVVAGAPSTEGEAYYRSVQARAESLGIDVEWLGWVPNPWDVIREASVFVLASDFEGFAMVVAEALGHGIPVVASDCRTGPREIVLPGKNGWLFPPGDVQALSELLMLIAEGKLALPDHDTCVQSVEKFLPERFVARLVGALQGVSGLWLPAS